MAAVERLVLEVGLERGEEPGVAALDQRREQRLRVRAERGGAVGAEQQPAGVVLADRLDRGPGPPGAREQARLARLLDGPPDPPQPGVRRADAGVQHERRGRRLHERAHGAHHGAVPGGVGLGVGADPRRPAAADGDRDGVEAVLGEQRLDPWGRRAELGRVRARRGEVHADVPAGAAPARGDDPLGERRGRRPGEREEVAEQNGTQPRVALDREPPPRERARQRRGGDLERGGHGGGPRRPGLRRAGDEPRLGDRRQRDRGRDEQPAVRGGQRARGDVEQAGRQPRGRGAGHRGALRVEDGDRHAQHAPQRLHRAARVGLRAPHRAGGGQGGVRALEARRPHGGVEPGGERPRVPVGQRGGGDPQPVRDPRGALGGEPCRHEQQRRAALGAVAQGDVGVEARRLLGRHEEHGRPWPDRGGVDAAGDRDGPHVGVEPAGPADQPGARELGQREQVADGRRRLAHPLG